MANAQVALVRGINVGGHNKVKMRELREALDAAGYEGVQTYIQSGNIVFTSAPPDTPDPVADIELHIKELTGLDVTVIGRTPTELAKIVKKNPFLAKGVDPAKLHVLFLEDTPSAAAVREMKKSNFWPDDFDPRGREVYLCYDAGMGRSRMTALFFEKVAGCPGTARNWTTITKLLEMAG